MAGKGEVKVKEEFHLKVESKTVEPVECKEEKTEVEVEFKTKLVDKEHMEHKEHKSEICDKNLSEEDKDSDKGKDKREKEKKAKKKDEEAEDSEKIGKEEEKKIKKDGKSNKETGDKDKKEKKKAKGDSNGETEEDVAGEDKKEEKKKKKKKEDKKSKEVSGGESNEETEDKGDKKGKEKKDKHEDGADIVKSKAEVEKVKGSMDKGEKDKNKEMDLCKLKQKLEKINAKVKALLEKRATIMLEMKEAENASQVNDEKHKDSMEKPNEIEVITTSAE